MDFCTIRDERAQTENKVFKVVPRSDVNEMVFNIRHSLSRSAFERTKLDANLTTCFQDRGKYEKVRAFGPQSEEMMSAAVSIFRHYVSDEQ